MTTTLGREWARLLPGTDAFGADLLRRWAEPHRRYHDTGHLAAALDALSGVGGTARPERLAIWFHDAVHTGTTGPDEEASATLAAHSLAGCGLPATEVAEVCRLVLVTVHHSPGSGDAAGARVSDADLAVLGADPATYAASVAALRAESPLATDAQWRAARLDRLAELLARDRLFHSPAGRRRWSVQATANLVAEQRRLLGLVP
ncbi:MAG: metal-dependent phosphohydrolase [Propionicimonas sp.]|uniref:HD domain-containing protein n=1 Tax=Propionicimonas sp. TaxID=1955623 RepID=UPI003D09F487